VGKVSKAKKRKEKKKKEKLGGAGEKIKFPKKTPEIGLCNSSKYI